MDIFGFILCLSACICSDFMIGEAVFRYFIHFYACISVSTVTNIVAHLISKTKIHTYKLYKVNRIKLFVSKRKKVLTRSKELSGQLLDDKLFYCLSLDTVCDLLMCRKTQIINYYEILISSRQIKSFN